MSSASAHLYLMLKFSMESPFLVNALEIWEKVVGFFFHTKIGWETDHGASWIRQQEDYVCSGAAPTGTGICLTMAMYRTACPLEAVEA